MNNGATVADHLERSLIEAVSAVLGMDAHLVDPKENLSVYGFDSITLTQLANKLNAMFPFLRPDASTFLEHTTVSALRVHFQNRHEQDFAAHFGTEAKPVVKPNTVELRRKEPSPEGEGWVTTARIAEDRATQEQLPRGNQNKENNLFYPPHPSLLPEGEGAHSLKSTKPPEPIVAYETERPKPVLAEISGSELLEAFDFDAQYEPEPSSFRSADTAANVTSSDIAVIGMAGRFPGADNAVAWWENLFNEKNSLTEVPKERWDWQALYGDPEAEGNLTDCRYGGFLDRPERFDALFFGISPLEAEQMDPQQKLVLQAVWECVENAGYSMEGLKGEAVGVYLGVQRNENLLQLIKNGREFGPYSNIGNSHSMLANRVSYFFDWKGDSLSVDTACAASSSALHLAYRALLRNEIKLALVGGVTVVQDAFSHIANRKMGLLTNEPKVRSYDRDAGGYLIGEGVATVLLKPLADAERDGDFIYGVIKGCSVAQSGKTVFLTAPDPKSHADAIRKALKEAELEPSDIDYIEGQGIGTELSDKAELKAYAEVFRGSESGRRPFRDGKLGVGSSKGNIGHVESASGIASLIKVCFAMKNGVIPPVLDFRELNWPHGEAEPPFAVLANKQDWNTRSGANGKAGLRRAGVHNFGYGGVTAHFVVEEYRNAAENRDAGRVYPEQEQLLVFSSKSRPQLDRYLARFLEYLQASQYRYFGIRRPALEDIAHTLLTGRQEMGVRLAVTAASEQELAAKLQRYLAGEQSVSGLYTGEFNAHKPQRNVPAALFQGRDWDAVAEQWTGGASLSEVTAKIRNGAISAIGRKIPLPNYCFADQTAPDEQTPANSAMPRPNLTAWRRFTGAFDQLDRIVQMLLLAHFQDWGLCLNIGEEFNPDDLRTALAVAPQHHRLFSVLPDILVNAGVLQPHQTRYRVIDAQRANRAELAERRDAFLREFPELAAQMHLTWDCLERLPDVLTGSVPATDILFPDNSMARIEGFYQGNPVVDYFNRLVEWQAVAAISPFVQNNPAGEKIRILEIGAGTGGTSTGLLQALAGYGERIAYVYSDISPGFTQFGKNKFGARYPFLEFKRLDIEKDIDAQGFENHGFDLIVAANVLHATADIDRTVHNVRRLLKPSGRIVLNEVTRAQDFVTLTFGLLSGWWAFNDEQRRLPGGPLLSSPMWAKLLKQQGFRSVEIYGQFGPDGQDTGYNVVSASFKESVLPTQTDGAMRTLSANAVDVRRTEPSPEGEGWVRGNQNKENNLFEPPHPNLLHEGEGVSAFKSTALTLSGMIALSEPEPAADAAISGRLRTILADILMIDAEQMALDAPYAEFGLDSFTSLKAVKAINDELGLQLRAAEMFNFPSINRLSAHIAQLLGKPATPVRATPCCESLGGKPLSPQPKAAAGDIAVIGMSGRFPHADNIEQYWYNLLHGVDCIDPVPAERWHGAGFHGGFIDGIDRFDPLFFNMSPKEAEWMDPQQRLFVQEAWRTFEHAGYSNDLLKGSRCGVFVGCREGDYQQLFAGTEASGYQGTGNSTSMLSARIAYLLDLKGPSLSIDTACSSSLVALHLACESINSGTCDMALAGGVSLFCTGLSHSILSKSGMLSPDGRCKTFDDSADGFVPAEGVGAVLLKPLAQALHDGDEIYGVIKAHGINQDGKTNGITASSTPSQSALQSDVYQRYGIDPERIGYIEAHGTGTSLGDPIEIDALTDSFRRYTERKQFCAVGSSKTNIGHSLAAAGIAGLIKILLSFRARKIPPSLHFKQENRHFRLAETPFFVNTEALDWNNENGAPLMAAINSFGFSGTNAHCVLEQGPRPVRENEEPGPHLIVLSAKSADGLNAKIADLAAWLETAAEPYSLHDIAATLLLGRSLFEYRAAFIADDKSSLAAALRAMSGNGRERLKIKPETEHGAALTQFGGRLLSELREQTLPEHARRENLLSLADLYCQGYPLDWRQLYQAADVSKQAFRKVSLPTYPFVGERYWFGGNVSQPARKVQVAAAENGLRPLPLPLATPELQSFRQAYANVPPFCALLLANRLRQMGAFTAPGESRTFEQLFSGLYIDPKYRRLFEALLNILLDEGYLTRDHDRFVRNDSNGAEWDLSLQALEQRKDRLMTEYSRIASFVNLVWVCVRRYPDVLQGKLNATEVMFPDSSFDLVKGIYQDNATADYYNRILVDNVRAYVEQRLAELPAGRQLQLLEIGAGTGSTSVLLMQALQAFAGRIDYLYTDISSGFIHYGRRTYGERYPFVRFDVLDIEKAVEPGSGLAQSFDIVVASNVLHATRNLSKTMDHVNALLRGDGCLFLNETTDIQAFATMTYGLLDGWWLFEDDIRLDNSPLLDADRWLTLLARKGYKVAPPLGISGGRSGPGQHILIAQREVDVTVTAIPVVNEVMPAAETVSAKLEPAELKQGIRQTVAEAIFHILGLKDEKLVAEKQFSDYGLDSISGIDFVASINERLGINVRVTALFDYPSVDALTDYIFDRFGETLSRVAPPNPAAISDEPVAANEQNNSVIVEPTKPALQTLSGDIAIIGLSGRFSGTRNADEFWDKLAAGISTISEPSAGRWPEGSFPDGYRAGFLPDIDRFDPLFFNWTGAEAEQADPQQRLFLEESYSALENAGYASDRLKQLKCGVFAGVGMSDYLINMREHGYPGEAQSFWGNSPAVVPARISYYLNLKGPSIAIDTACSASLVAIHSARQSLLAGECDMALAGGVYLCTTPHFHTLADKAQMLAPDGKCKAFDQRADGFVFGEGVGAIVLKRLEHAIRDKDHIYGVLKASGVNQDGKTNGITAPSTLSQSELEIAVYEQAGIDPDTISYVEAHGTGTKLGDPVEVEALSEAFRRYTDRKQFCRLGSVKTNIGHASLAAGIASVIKVLQCFEHRKIPPLLNFSEANEHIDLASSPFRINTAPEDWIKNGQTPRRAAVSGFGLGGTNAHLVLEEAPERTVSEAMEADRAVLIVLSAKSAEALRQKRLQLADYLEGRQYPLADVAYTLQIGREHFGYRFAVVASKREQLLHELRRDEADHSYNSGLAGDSEQWLTEIGSSALNEADALAKLAGLYLGGSNPDWTKMHADRERYRVPLPSYPFERSRYWFPVSENVKTETVQPPVRAIPDTDQDAMTWWRTVWQPSPTIRRPSDNVNAGPLLVFGFAGQQGFPSQDGPVILVVEGEDFAVSTESPDAALTIRLLPDRREHYRQLADVLAQRRLLPNRILHCWSQLPSLAEDTNKHLERCFYSLMFTAQAFMQTANRLETIRLLYAFVRSKSRDYALNRAMSGFTKTLSRENPGFICRTMELPEAALQPPIALEEFRHLADNESEVRYRHKPNGDLVREAKVWQAAELMPAAEKPLALKEQGTYLLIGGAGGIGLVFCRYLSRLAATQQNRINVFLTGRRPLAAATQAHIDTLNSAWCRIVYIHADISRPDQAEAAVLKARGPQGGIAGVFHFAGCTRDAFLSKKTESECEQVFAAKIRGTLNLERALAGIKVDFVSLFSSAGAVSGNVGQADYAYANAFLDTVAEQGGIGGARTFSVNWAWWREGGMPLPEGKAESLAETTGVRPLSNGTALRAWTAMLHSDLHECLFLSGDREKIRRFVEQGFADRQVTVQPAVSRPITISEIYRQADAVGKAKPETAPKAAAPATNGREIEAFVAQAVADVSRLPRDKIDLKRPLDEYGLDSLMITALNEKLNARFGQLPATLFFEYPDLASLSAFLAERFAAEPSAANEMRLESQKVNSSAIAEIMRRAETIGYASEAAGKADAEPVFRNVATGSADIATFLIQAVADVSRLPKDKIDLKRPLDEYGLDSLMITALNEKLNARFGQLPATLFFEYPDLAALSVYLSGRFSQEAPVADTKPTVNAPERSSSIADIVRRAETIGRDDKTPEHTERKDSAIAEIYRKAESVGYQPAADNGQTVAAEASSAPNRLRQTESFLLQAVAEVTGLSPDKISLHRPMDEYALDSLMITALNEKLNARYERLPATLFFEYSDLASLSVYLSAIPQTSAPVRPVSAGEAIARQAENIGLEPKPAQADDAGPGHTTYRPSQESFAGQTRNAPAGNASFDIAIIGVSGIYPDAEDLEAFWDNLRSGKDSIIEVPGYRWHADDYYDPDRAKAMQGKMYCKWGGFVKDADCFDAGFFNITPREAKLIDPCERWFLQIAWAAFEDAGYTRKKLADSCGNKVGVFAGISNYGYSLWGPQEWAKGNMYTPVSGLWSIANRLSYFMNFHGPSFPVDTACSSSLTAVHQACMSLKNGECEMALAGGASFNVHPHQYIAMCQGQMLSPTGRCHSFGAEGDGFVPGEGVGAVLLKPLSRAEADRDPIYAVIKASSVNHGGRTNGYSVPNPKAQAELIRIALDQGGVDPATISYVEAHGTGTALGDPVEFEGLCQAWSNGRSASAKQSCALGSVKTNIGHLGAAAGISGLTKILLQMKHKTLAPSLHSERLNPDIDFADSPFYMQHGLSPWDTKQGDPRRNAVDLSRTKPSPEGEGWVTTARMQEIEQRREQLPRGKQNKENSLFAPPHPDLLPEGEGVSAFKSTALNPRRAAISSFGAGGANAHVILEDYDVPDNRLADNGDSIDQIVILSAKTPERLQAYAEKLSAFWNKHGDALRLRDLAYTLQTGREAMPERLAFVARNKADVGAILNAFLRQEGAGKVYYVSGNSRLESGEISPDADLSEYAARWATGQEIDWPQVPGWERRSAGAACISLPTYPFAKNAYWYAEKPAVPEASPADEPIGELLARHEKVFSDLATLGANGLLKALQQLGCFRGSNEVYGRDELKARIRLHDDYDGLFDALLDILETAGFAETVNGRIRCTQKVAEPADMHSLDYWLDRHPESAASLQLLWRCLDKLCGILQGAVPATDVIFPGSSMELVESIYRDNAVSDYYNRLVADEAVAAIRERLPGLAAGEKINLLEIGAGTGGTSAAVLKAVEPYREQLHYDYTDISLKFVRHGRERFGRYAFADYRVLNIEREPERQGFALQQADVIIATNVLHATRNMKTTLGNVKALLRAGGRLIVNEAVENHVFSTLTFGLLKGWWLAEDSENRLPHSPLLNSATWMRLLKEQGFVSVQTKAPLIEQGVSQNVFSAIGDGRLASRPEPAIVQPVRPVPDKAPANAEPGDNSRLADTIIRIVAAVTEVDAKTILPDAPYADIGVDSILSIEIIDRLNRELGIELRSTALFDHSTVNFLAAHIASQHKQHADEEDELLKVFEQLHGGNLSVHEADRLLDSR